MPRDGKHGCVLSVLVHFSFPFLSFEEINMEKLMTDEISDSKKSVLSGKLLHDNQQVLCLELYGSFKG